jgi:hypothetical protein
MGISKGRKKRKTKLNKSNRELLKILVRQSIDLTLNPSLLSISPIISLSLVLRKYLKYQKIITNKKM